MKYLTRLSLILLATILLSGGCKLLQRAKTVAREAVKKGAVKIYTAEKNIKRLGAQFLQAHAIVRALAKAKGKLTDAVLDKKRLEAEALVKAATKLIERVAKILPRCEDCSADLGKEEKKSKD